MRSFIGLSFITALIIVCFNSCSKNNNISQPVPIKKDDVVSAAIKIAKIWKNGTAISLTNGSNNAVANSIYVVGNDVYVAGYESNGTNNVAKLWKNGVATSLTNGSAHAEGLSVYVSGNDVYVAGFENEKAVVWKNNVVTYLTNGNWYSKANSVYVNGNDVYVAGIYPTVVGNTGSSTAAFWKNGVANPLPSIGSTATSVYVSNDVYVIGKENGDYGNAKLWKSGLVTTVGNDAPNTSVNSVFISAGNVYLCGIVVKYVHPNLMGQAAVWKNNTVTFLTDGTTRAMANSVYVSNNDTYVVGYENPGAISTPNGTGGYNVVGRPNIAKLWKNGVATSLTDGTKQALAYSVFVSGSDVYVAGYETK